MFKRKAWMISFIVLILAVVGGIGGWIAYTLNTYRIETVYVEGNVHYSQEEIRQIVMSGPLGNNSKYLAWKYKNKGIRDIPFVDVVDVNIMNPTTIKITVYEKALAGYVSYLDTLFYFDKDGYVIESSSIKTVGVPQITGLHFDSVVLGEMLPIENPEIFNQVLDITKLLNKYELKADKIYFQSSGKVTLIFGDVKVALGNEPQWLEDKMMRLPIFMQSLEGKKGTLQMETYVEKGEYSFKPDKN